MKPFKYILKSLFNNAVILEGRKRKWYEAFVVFLLAMIVALVPTVVSIASVKGSEILESNTNSVDIALVEFSKTINEEGIKLVVEENEDTKSLAINDASKWNRDYYSYKRLDDNTSVERLRVYLLLDKNSEEVAKKITDLQSQVYNPESENEQDKTPISSFFVLGKDSGYLCVYAKNAKAWNSPSSARYITYDNFEGGQEVISSFVGEHALDNWKTFINKGYSHTKVISLFRQLGIFAGINILVSLFMALMIFIVTRGKRNPYRDYKFSEALKIVGVASLAPALISLLLGFILPQQYAAMIFMVLLGIRIMWLSSRNLNPVAQQ